MGEGLADVEIASGAVFDPLQDLEDMAPGQLCNRLLHNWADREALDKISHRLLTGPSNRASFVTLVSKKPFHRGVVASWRGNMRLPFSA